MKHMRDGGAPLSDISIKRVGTGITFGLLATLLGILLFSALISSDKIGPGAATLCAAAALFAGGLVASFLSCGRRRMLISASLTALGLTAALALVGGAAFSGEFSVKMCFLMLIIELISCILGSVIASIVK